MAWDYSLLSETAVRFFKGIQLSNLDFNGASILMIISITVEFYNLDNCNITYQT